LQSADKYSIMESMIDRNKRVYVYFNLHKKVWSVRQDGRVIEHTKSIMLKDCKYLVGKAGRERVLREGRKNVHAGVSGYVVDKIPPCRYENDLIYNPKWHEGFVSRLDPYDDVIEYSHYAHLECGNDWKNLQAMWTGS
jgi:hypothetical protein